MTIWSPVLTIIVFKELQKGKRLLLLLQGLLIQTGDRE